MKRLIIFLKLHWLKVLVIAIFSAVLLTTVFFLHAGLNNYFSLEAFNRRQISAYMGFFLIIGIFTAFIQLPLFFGMHYFFMQGGGLGQLGMEKLSKAKVKVKWDEVIGMESAKKEAWEIVKLLKDRSLLKAIGGQIIKGTLMIGPPGCGKTYLAKAIATECGLPMISASGSEFVGMFVGQGAARMKSLFKQARAMASLEGGCIIFIDEIDSFARHRMGDTGWGGSISHNATINQFLTELDGLRQRENNIVVLAATNVDEYELDAAVMRAGRFDRKIYVTRPNLKEREELFKFYLSRVKIDESVKSDFLARKTLWFSPSDISGMVREAGLIALREARQVINNKDLSTAYDRVLYGEKSNLQLREKDKIWVAYHEAGHAVISYLLHPTDDVIKATIIPHKGALGFVAPRPREEIYIHNREWFLAEIKTSLASYAAEQIKFGTTGSGVSADFRNAIVNAHQMVWDYGMGKSGLMGSWGFLENHPQHFTISEQTKAKLDEDVQFILQSCIKEVTDILSEKRELLDCFAGELLKKNELEYDEIQAIFHKFNLEPASRSPETI
jgi:cell division protease FtsH